MNNNKKKTFLLASAGLIALSVMAVVLFEQKGGGFYQLRATTNSSRVVTVNSNNRILDFYDGGKQYFGGAMFQLNDKQAYNFIYASQSQKDVFENHNDCVLALWGNNSSGVCSFTVNYNTNIEYTFDEKGTNKITLAKFRHLTKIHITLDKGNGTDRYTSLKSFKDSVEFGTFTLLKDEATYVKYEWVPEGGFLGSDEKVDFKPTEALWQNKAIWLTEFTFYYDC